uniref:G-protein coupled receptors family 1 profile domain-containing protein n=1 Tax=Oncorhynchus tshawytscha TaxID=74940 RepID=A0A8C8D1T1_ONCTS
RFSGGVCLGLILVLGFFNNLLVLLIFTKFRSLWTPINLILLNISVSDILVCMCGIPFSFAASLQGRWLIGHHGCNLLVQCCDIWLLDIF